MEKKTVKVSKITINNFKNVEYGTIDFVGTRKKDLFFANILGIYGQNGSGKTSIIEAIAILKIILSGASLPHDCANYVMEGKEFSHIDYYFEINIGLEKFQIQYSVDLVKKVSASETNIESEDDFEKYQLVIENEVLSMSSSTFKKQPIINTTTTELPFIPKRKFNEIIGRNRDLINKLMVGKQLANERSRSFIFSKDTINAIRENCKVSSYISVIDALVQYGNYYLYVVDTKSTGLINLNAALPFFFRLVNEKRVSTGNIPIKLEGQSIVPIAVYKIVQKTITNMNVVLEQLVPGLNINLEKLGSAFIDSKNEGCIVELVSIRNKKKIPLRYESEGIKKIVSILQLLIVMYNNEGITVAVDELDAGVFEYLLGELLKIISETGKGQLIFTSHNLRPLETLDKKSVIFTTTNPLNRYIRLENVQTNNNLRDFYYRDIILGGQKEELYDITNNYEIELSLKEASNLDDN